MIWSFHVAVLCRWRFRDFQCACTVVLLIKPSHWQTRVINLPLLKIFVFFPCSNDVNVADQEGNTALHVASLSNKTECMRVLLRAGATDSLSVGTWTLKSIFFTTYFFIQSQQTWLCLTNHEQSKSQLWLSSFYAWHVLLVFPRFAAVSCFPAIVTGCVFSRVWHRLRVFPPLRSSRFSRTWQVACFLFEFWLVHFIVFVVIGSLWLRQFGFTKFTMASDQDKLLWFICRKQRWKNAH